MTPSLLHLRQLRGLVNTVGPSGLEALSRVCYENASLLYMCQRIEGMSHV